jgi:hypothetical protein
MATQTGKEVPDIVVRGRQNFSRKSLRVNITSSPTSR